MTHGKPFYITGRSDVASRRLFTAVRISRSCAALCLIALSACAERGTDPSVAPGINDRYATDEGRAVTRKILEGEGRDTYQKPAELIRNMELGAGTIVCEIGAGTGYFTPFLARAVGGSGKVYAQDPQPEFLEVLKEKTVSLALSNVELVRGTYTDTNLPDGVCDVTFVLDAYHHFEWPQQMLKAMRRDTKPNGRLIIVDWYRRPNPVFSTWAIDPMKHLRLDLDGVVEEVVGFGWEHVDTRRFLDHQYFVVFRAR